MRRIIMLSGKKQAGKDSTADFIVKQGKVTGRFTAAKTSFADSLKQFCINALGLTHAQCYGTDADKNTYTQWDWEGLGSLFKFNCCYKDTDEYSVASTPTGPLTARQVMQFVGTIMRDNFNKDVWVIGGINAAKASPTDYPIMVDARYPNEVEASRKAGALLIRIVRQNSPVSADSHVSEVALDHYTKEQFDYWIEAANLSQLYEKVSYILHRENIL